MQTRIIDETSGETRPTPRGSAVDKVESFKWRELDKRAEFAWIPKEQLQVDRSYQRALSKTRITKIAADWSWISCGALAVALREASGEYVVIDGQHRAAAACVRSDIAELPCLLYGVITHEQEATGFLRANTARKNPTMFERFNALIATGDPIAKSTKQLADEIGRSIAGSASSSSISCVTALMKAVRRNGDALRKVWPLLNEICEGHTFHENILAGIVYIEKGMPEGSSLTDARWKERILQSGYDGLMREIANTSVFYGKGGDKIWAAGIAKAINKGLRNPLKYIGSLEIKTAEAA